MIALVGLLTFSSIGCSGEADDRASLPQITDITVKAMHSTKITLTWRTSVPTDGTLSYGTDSTAFEQSEPVRATTTYHRVTLEGLKPSTRYYCRIQARSMGGATATSGAISAITPTSDIESVDAAPLTGGYDVAVIDTDLGQIIVRFLDKDAPTHTKNFRELTAKQFYDGLIFHRVVPGFMIQGGDPLSKRVDETLAGRGGPGYTLRAEIGASLKRGSIAASRLVSARRNPLMRSNGSQFFICVGPQPQIEGRYTVFGEVVKGMDVVEQIARSPRNMRTDRPLRDIRMKTVRIRNISPGEKL